MNAQRIILVDCEAAGVSPVRGTLTEFGAEDFTTRGSFYGRLWQSTPDPDNPAIPVPDFDAGPSPLVSIDRDTGGAEVPVRGIDAVFQCFAAWVVDVCDDGRARPIFVSDNPAYDWMWVAAGFDVADLPNPFGHSARRIGDFAAGLAERWGASSAWKRQRRTPHDHNPVHDCLGNTEALAVLLAEAQARPPVHDHPPFSSNSRQVLT